MIEEVDLRIWSIQAQAQLDRLRETNIARQLTCELWGDEPFVMPEDPVAFLHSLNLRGER